MLMKIGDSWINPEAVGQVHTNFSFETIVVRDFKDNVIARVRRENGEPTLEEIVEKINAACQSSRNLTGVDG